jgi:integral membrane protein (TIGR01906 family)
MTVETAPEPAAARSSPLYLALAWLTTLLVPIVVVLTAVRLLLMPWFLTFEYNTPGFPPDPYGFTYEDRLSWSRLSMQYLTNKAGPEFWASQRLPNGDAVYTERELDHFMDAKVTLQGALRVWNISVIVLLALGLWAWRRNWLAQYLHGLSRGGWLTLGLIAVIILLVIIAFNQLFVVFHQIFFPQGNWMFNYSDTFIRLFPERFWRDIFIYVGVFSALAGAAIAYFGGKIAANVKTAA